MKKISLDSIPSELHSLVQWVGAKNKIPMNPHNGGRASSTDPETWGTIEEAFAGIERFGFDGIGFVFTHSDPYVGIDLDHVIDDITNETDEEKFNLAMRLDSYAEWSQSGHGIHVIVKGSLPPSGRKKAGYEMYDEGRFFITTGNQIPGTPDTIEERQNILLDIHYQIFGNTETLKTKIEHQTIPIDIDDKDLLDKMFNSKHGTTIRDLWHGNLSKFSNDANDGHSEADLALCSHLAFWTGGDTARIDSLFRQSGLMRPKWNRDDYRSLTINKASNQATFYNPSFKSQRFIPDFSQPSKLHYDPPLYQSHLKTEDDTSRFRYIFDQQFHSDITNGKLLIAEYGHLLRYISKWQSWLTYHGGIWNQDDQGYVNYLAKCIVGNVGKESSNWLSKLLDIDPELLDTLKSKEIDFYKESATASEEDNEKQKKKIISIGKAKNFYMHAKSSSNRVNHMVESAVSEEGLHVSINRLDNYPMKITCENGVINLKTGELEPFNPEFYLTKKLNIPYDPEAKAPRWVQFITEIMGGFVAGEDTPDMTAAELERRYQAEQDSAALSDYLQRCVGYSLTGSTKEHVMFIMHGSGSNGKSLFITVIMQLMGEFAKKATESLVMVNKHNNHPTELADLFGKRFVAASETTQGRRLNESLIKEMTGGDIITARRMREDFWQFQPTHKFWMATNHEPVVKDASEGMWRRIQKIPFTVQFQKPDKADIDPHMPFADLDLEQKLMQELPGILAWAVQGAVKWSQDGLHVPSVVKDATEAYRAEQDMIGRFLEEKCVMGNQYQCSVTALWNAYKQWCEVAGENPGKQTGFGKEMTARGFHRTKPRKTWVYLNLGMIDENHDQ